MTADSRRYLDEPMGVDRDGADECRISSQRMRIHRRQDITRRLLQHHAVAGLLGDLVQRGRRAAPRGVAQDVQGDTTGLGISHSSQAAMPSPRVADTSNTSISALTRRACAMQRSTSKLT